MGLQPGWDPVQQHTQGRWRGRWDRPLCHSVLCRRTSFLGLVGHHRLLRTHVDTSACTITGVHTRAHTCRHTPRNTQAGTEAMHRCSQVDTNLDYKCVHKHTWARTQTDTQIHVCTHTPLLVRGINQSLLGLYSAFLCLRVPSYERGSTTLINWVVRTESI